MFPHTVTLFNVYKKKDIVYYHRTLLTGVFFYKSNMVVDEGKGIVNSSQYHCIIPLEQLTNYVDRKKFNALEPKTNKFTFAPKDVIVFGECESINSITELQSSTYDYFTIKTINDNRYGSNDLQSIEVRN
ncbi:MAG: DUF6751 family protein [Bacilli bacterium]